MSNELMKLGPLAGFLLAVGYCVWPHVAPPPHQAEPTSELPKIDSKLLTPDFGPPSARDPFRHAHDLVSLAAQPSDDKASKTTAVSISRSKGPGTGVAPRSSAPVFALGATLVAGERRAAIIDGRVYRQGESLEGPEGSSGISWTVTRIESDRVVLGRENHRDSLVLELPDRLAALMAEAGPTAADASRDRVLRAGLETLTEARAALAAAGVPLPVPDLMEQIARQSGGSLPEISRALLRLLVAPPSSAARSAPALAASGEGSR